MLKNFFSKIAQKVKKSPGFEKKWPTKVPKTPKTVSHRFKVFFCDEGDNGAYKNADFFQKTLRCFFATKGMKKYSIQIDG